MSTDIGALISRLDDPSTDIAEGAKHTLIAGGAVVIPEVAAGLPGLDRFGKLSAIEVFEARRLPGSGRVTSMRRTGSNGRRLRPGAGHRVHFGPGGRAAGVTVCRCGVYTTRLTHDDGFRPIGCNAWF